MFDIPGSDIVSVEVDEDAVFGRNPVRYRYSGSAKSKDQEMKNSTGEDEVKTALAGE